MQFSFSYCCSVRQCFCPSHWKQVQQMADRCNPKSSRHKFCFYYFMKSSSFKLLDGKWAEWEEQEAENRCDKGQQELQEQTILHVQRRGNITNQRATLGRDSVFFSIFHLRSGWSCRTPLCCTLTQVTDSCNDRVTQPERAPPTPGNRYTHAAVDLPPRVRATRRVLVFFSFSYNLKRSQRHLKASPAAEAHLHLSPTPTLILQMRAIMLYHPS